MGKNTKPVESDRMPPGIPHIIGNEAAERFSFYGMKAILAVFFVEYMYLMDYKIGKPMDETRAAELVHLFNGAFYLTPILGAILADVFLGKYKVIIGLSLLYCAGHAALALMGQFGNSDAWMISGLVMIALGAGGIKPCVSAHVGDQFGARNSHLLPRVFDWFYFSINLGAFISMLLTPWLLEWYGPHWAFGVPGILMAIATLIFWLGRNRFAHVPAGGLGFLKEVFSKDGLLAMLKLAPLYLFVAMFWALFDQSGSTWIFQSEDMDRHFLGFEWLPSQIQTLNSVFVLSFIPIFSLIIYPWVGRFCPLSPLRKMGAGFFLMSTAFVIISLIQVRIDAGERPHIIWQIAAFALLTASEILVSIVALEFAYTQAPRKMKSFIMCFYLAAVALGNFLVAGVNHFIRIPSAAEEQLALAFRNLPEDWQKDPRTVVLPGFDPSNPAEAYIRRLDTKHGSELEVPGQALLDRAAKIIISAAEAGGSLPDEEAGKKLLSQSKDLWGRPLRYVTLNSSTVRIWSAGPDAQWNTKWDIGIIISKSEPAFVAKPSWLNSLRPQEPWLETRKRDLGLASSAIEQGCRYSQRTFSGGQTRLQGAAYFWFFSALMLVTSILFVPLAIWFRPKSYLQDS